MKMNVVMIRGTFVLVTAILSSTIAVAAKDAGFGHSQFNSVGNPKSDFDVLGKTVDEAVMVHGIGCMCMGCQQIRDHAAKRRCEELSKTVLEAGDGEGRPRRVVRRTGNEGSAQNAQTVDVLSPQDIVCFRKWLDAKAGLPLPVYALGPNILSFKSRIDYVRRFQQSVRAVIPFKGVDMDRFSRAAGRFWDACRNPPLYKLNLRGLEYERAISDFLKSNDGLPVDQKAGLENALKAIEKCRVRDAWQFRRQWLYYFEDTDRTLPGYDENRVRLLKKSAATQEAQLALMAELQLNNVKPIYDMIVGLRKRDHELKK